MTAVATTMLATVSVTVGIAVMLAFLGMREGALRARPEPRRCPLCGLRLRSWTCSNCTDSHGS
jgi:hypothetical protein